MTVQSNENGVCLVMNAISSRPSASSMKTKKTLIPQVNKESNRSCQTILQSISECTFDAEDSASTTDLTKKTVLTVRVPNSSMAVTSTIPSTGTRSVSPCSAAIPFGSGSVPGGAPESDICGAVSMPTVSAINSTGSGAVVNTGSSTANRCCDTGRTIYTDPVSGQTLCSCQYDMISYQRLAAAGNLVTGPANVPLGVYPEGMSAYLSGIATDQPPFYANTTALDLKENLVSGGTPWPYPSMYHPYDAAFAAYPFNSYGMDLNGARRKNATRETTSTLKAWLNEHKKNPYPTKGEKIMLAIITKMTLTQVSTWFANARRRLKKENKMTWEPRNRVDDDDANIDDDDQKSADDNDTLDAKDSGLGLNEDKSRSVTFGDMLADPAEGNASEWSGSRPGSPNGSPDLYDRPSAGIPSGGQAIFHPAAIHHHHFRPHASSPTDIVAYHHHQQQLLQQQQQTQHNTLHSSGIGATTTSLTTKPRIWSLADMASKDRNDNGKNDLPCQALPSAHTNLHENSLQHPSSGKILSPVAAHIPNFVPYARPDMYRGFYGTSATGHITANSPDFLEHQRTLNTNLPTHNTLNVNPLLWKAAVSAGNTCSPHFTPISLSTNQHSMPTIIVQSSGVSPSASSTSSSNACDAGQPFCDNLIQNNVDPVSCNSTSLSSNSSHSGKLSPSINVTPLGSKP